MAICNGPGVDITTNWWLSTSISDEYSSNPYVTNGHSHHYQFDESTIIFRVIRRKLLFLFHFSMKILVSKQYSPR